MFSYSYFSKDNTYHGLKIKVQFVQAGLQNLPVDGNFQVNIKAPGTSLKFFVTLLENLKFNENSHKSTGYQQYECSFRKNCNSLSLAHQFALARGTGDA